MTVSSKVGNAVVRARVKRRLREIFRRRRALLPAGVDVVVVARSAAASASFEELRRCFEDAAGRAQRRLARGGQEHHGASR